VNYKQFIKRLIILPFKSGRLVRSIFEYPGFILQWLKYCQSSNESVKISNWYPMLEDATTETSFDPHYFYQSAWLAKKLSTQKVSFHVDVGSQINLIASLSGFMDIEFIDIRPLTAALSGLKNIKGSILDLPYPDKSLKSVSSLHVIEHIGLGRYGDPLDTKGSQKACKELQRVISDNGNLYISVPIGIEQVEFNAHRIFTPKTIVTLFNDLVLEEFSVVDDSGMLQINVPIENYFQLNYGLGLFHFSKH
jgi:hypothetical protein